MNDIFFLQTWLEDWSLVIAMVASAIGIWVGVAEFGRNNRIKRTEFLEKLIAEFNHDKLFLAKRILDDFWIVMHPAPGKAMTDPELIKEGSKLEVKGGKLREEVTRLLRDHREEGAEAVTAEGEHRARQSFDDLLDFFTKLDYYLTLRMIYKQELYYFRYYIKRCAFKAKGAVMGYAKAYGYPALFRLFYVLNIDPTEKKKMDKEEPDKPIYNGIPEFESDKQKDLYKKLRDGQ